MNLKELAQHLGLSQTTVSRALNGYPEVSEATRRRVLEAAGAVGYRPNTRAKALATGRSMTIGHVLPRADRTEIVNPIFSDFISGAAEVYLSAGYSILLSIAAETGDAKAFREMVDHHAVDGLVLHAPRLNDPRIAILTEIGLPFVVHGRASGVEIPYSWVDVDNRRSFRRATAFLADLGHSRIALVNGREHMDYAHRRRTGYVEALGERGIPVDEGLMRSGEMTEEYGYEAARSLLARGDPPTAFLAASMITAIGIRRAAEEVGLKLGRDLSVITYDDDLSYFRNGGAETIFTALRSSVREAGLRAAERLIALIEQPGEPTTLMLETDLVIGNSTGPAPSPLRLRKA